jgi:hypothetical protein
METLDGSSARDEFAASFNTFSRNILCEVIGRVEGVRDLVNADPGVGSGLTMTLESANLVCARLVRTCFYRVSLQGVEISYAYASDTDFSRANLVDTTFIARM